MQFTTLAAALTLLAAGSANAQAMQASFTEYGTNDQGGSSTCNSVSASCGFYNNPGFNVAVSQNVFGAPNGVGPGCGHCWQLSANGKTIVVKVNNLCPNTPENSQWCGITQMGETNKVGAQVHFDLCIDSGAPSALLGGAGTGMGIAQPVDCSQWQGGPNITQ